jgi:hypothetical protein
LSNGIYFYRIEINGISKTNKMILVRWNKRSIW